MQRKRIKDGLGLLCAGLAVAALGRPAHAQNVTILNVAQGNAPDGSIVYTNTFGDVGTPGPTDVTGVFSIVGVDDSHPYRVSYATPNGYAAVGTPINATL